MRNHKRNQTGNLKNSLVTLYHKWVQDQSEYEKRKLNHSSSEEVVHVSADKPKKVRNYSSMTSTTPLVASASAGTIYKLKPKYLTTNFNFDAMSATITEAENNFKNLGVFRTHGDLVGMSWQTKDELGHVDFRYPEDRSLEGVKLTYNYQISGYTPLMNEIQAPVMTVKTHSGREYYVRLWNYVMNRPEDDWERGSNYHFPQGRTIGNGTGVSGTIEIDFDELYAGWSAYHFQSTILGFGSWEKNPEWVKVPVNDIKEIMWSIAPLNFGQENLRLEDSMEYEIKFTNWTVAGDSFLCNDFSPVSVSPIRICDGYDDIYNMTPERVVSEYASLGYGGIVNMYIGASHFYDKKYDSVDDKLNVISDYPFNVAFEGWYKNYIQCLRDIGIHNLVHSVSMENVNPPESWIQRAWNGKPATSGWTPTPYLLSFTNQEVRNFYQSYVLNLARLSDEAGMRPIIQLGEPWWWFMEDGQTNVPCFYDESTRQMYTEERGELMHVFRSGNDSIEGHEDVLYFLRDKNGAFSHMLRDAVKASYPNALFTVLFFPPSVIDKNRVPPKMSIVNFPKEHWKSPNLDFFMLEDYDYLIDNDMDKHDEAMVFVQNNLGYPANKIHYFSGVVLNQEHLDVWSRINQALNDAFNLGFAETYIWAYAQIKRDGWKPQEIIYANKYSGNYKEPMNITLSCAGADSLIYTLDGSKPSLSHGTIYSGPIYVNTTLVITVISTKNSVESTPIAFKYTKSVRPAFDAKINVDGNVGDWSDITALSVGDRRIFDLSAVQSADRLYILVRGSQMDTSSNLYIDVHEGSPGGFRLLPWAEPRADFMVSNDTVYKYNGSGQDWIWEEIGVTQIAKTPSVVELSVPLGLIGLDAPQQINLGFGRGFEDFAPLSGTKMAVANKTITTAIIPVSDVYISSSSMTMNVSETGNLQATVAPSDVTNKAVMWQSSNTDVVTVDNSGRLFAKRAGTATITVRAVADSSKYAVCTVTAMILAIDSLKVYQYKRWPGKIDGPDSDPAPDMLVGGKSKSQLYNMSLAIGNAAQLYDPSPLPPEGPGGPETVKTDAKLLATIFTVGDTSAKPIVEELFDHFLDGTGTDYRNSDLTQRVIGHKSTQNYIDIAKKQMIDYIRKNNGNPNGAISAEDLKATIDQCKPQFSTSDDRWNGLTISINDTWGNYIEVENYQCNGVIFNGTLKFTIYDHFGLDDGDVTGEFGEKDWLLGQFPGFASWYVLQRYEGCNELYKPFITYFETSIPFGGFLS